VRAREDVGWGAKFSGVCTQIKSDQIPLRPRAIVRAITLFEEGRALANGMSFALYKTLVFTDISLVNV
jgi:hypothetical protein